MENLDDKSSVKNNSDKPFIRTMEDDLKKIKNSPAGKDGIASAISASSTVRREENLPLKEIKKPTPFQSVSSESAPVSAPVTAPFKTPAVKPTPVISLVTAPSQLVKSASTTGLKSVSEPVFSAPGNLPIDNLIIEKKGSDMPIKEEVLKPADKPKLFSESRITDDHKLNEIGSDKESMDIEKQKEKTLPVFKASSVASNPVTPVFKPAPSVPNPVPPVSSDRIFEKKRSASILDEETEKLPPEARLARQSSFNIDNEKKEPKESFVSSANVSKSPITRPLTRSSLVASERLSEPVQSSYSLASNIPPLNNKKSIEEIIKEDSSDSVFKKIIKVLFTVLIIAGISIGGYYLYFSKSPAQTPPTDENLINKALVDGTTEVVIDADLNANLINDIVLFFSTTKTSGIYKLVLRDKNSREYLKLENIGKSLNIILPDYIVNSLEKEYNLIVFNYPEKNYLRLGLVLKSNNSVDISAVTRNWEAIMYRGVKPMFVNNSGIYEEAKPFRSNVYNNFNIRYLPLGFENIGLNYAIDNEKKFLLIATSKDDVFILIDKLIKGN